MIAFGRIAHRVVVAVHVAWINSPPTAIDGGARLSDPRSIPTIVGTLACDIVMNEGEFYRKGKSACDLVDCHHVSWLWPVLRNASSMTWPESAV